MATSRSACERTNVTTSELETPDAAGDLYRARSDEVEVRRPVFTGDVFDVGGELHIIVEHACALRSDGVRLKPSILCAPVRPVAAIRTNWSKESFRLMPLPDLTTDGTPFAAHLDQAVSLTPDLLTVERRVAALSEYGVNLLMQRWVHYLTRFVAPTFHLAAAIAAEYEEADLTLEWLEELADDETIVEETIAFHRWIREELVAGQDLTRQAALKEGQRRSEVRRQLRTELRVRLAAR